MNIIVYCQHVLGIGHLFRILEITRALDSHRLTLVLGGPPVEIPVPDHVRIVQLPGLMMDSNFSRLLPVDAAQSLEKTKQQRTERLLDLAENIRPDVLLVELYPFGRSSFHFELGPLLRLLRNRKDFHCRIVCSLRDILVEKEKERKFEQRVLDRLNPFFDAVLVHGDPNVITLETTFSRARDITIPVFYTGYVCQKPKPGDRQSIRSRLRLGPGERLVTVSAGGGAAGFRLLESALKAHNLQRTPGWRMQVFTGPYLDEAHFTALRRLGGPDARIDRFSNNFPAWLAAADLSISMGGYNTTMNVVAAGTPALVLPFRQNREQRLRAERLAGLADLAVLEDTDLEPALLAKKMTGMIGSRGRTPSIQLDGAQQTADFLEQLGPPEISSNFRSAD